MDQSVMSMMSCLSNLLSTCIKIYKLGGRTRITGSGRPGCLAELVSSGFHEWPWLKRIRWERLKKALGLNLWPPRCTHTYLHIYLCKHTWTCMCAYYTQKKSEEREVCKDLDKHRRCSLFVQANKWHRQRLSGDRCVASQCLCVAERNGESGDSKRKLASGCQTNPHYLPLTST